MTFDLNDVVMLREHLSHNFVPPIGDAYDCAKQAIEAVNEGKYTKKIETPSGQNMPAGEIIEELHLDFFIDDEHYSWE